MHRYIECAAVVYSVCAAGTILWSIDDGVIHRTWNFYNVLIMPDFTQDGVPEILLSHGGDPRFRANVRHGFKL